MIWTTLTVVVVAAAGTVVSVIATITGTPPAHASLQFRTRQPLATATVLSGSGEAIAARTAGLLFAAAPAAVVADGNKPAEVAAAAAIARRVHAPLLLAADRGGPHGLLGRANGPLRAEVRSLNPGTVLAVGLPVRQLSALLPRVHVVARVSELPRTATPPQLKHLVLLLHRAAGAGSAGAQATRATASVAGAKIITIRGYDPRTDPAAIRALAAARPRRVLAVGAGFGSAGVLSYRVAIAETGKQLPGGGQVLFPMRKIVALYGNPTTPALGALGQQGLTASIARAKRVAAQYNNLTRVPVIPAFEIIATVAQGSPGPTGSYSYESTVSSLRPWVSAATAAGMYVILDLQPGRDNLLAQAKRYRSLLLKPNVGLALDPEWKLQPGQLPLRQIGSVSITEINSVVNWLARLTARHHLPQKLLELHQFRLSMIQNEARLNTRHNDLAIVINMDGQGAPSVKQQTWAAIIAAAPRGVHFGWKDFYVKDKPMLGPAATIEHRPTPVLISYQ
ncbi:MAG: hypothetical protein ACLQFR_10935 [Streptosporangiaceae bacterium]